MSFLLDPLASDLNDLLDPLTSAIAPEPDSTPTPKPTPTRNSHTNPSPTADQSSNNSPSNSQISIAPPASIGKPTSASPPSQTTNVSDAASASDSAPTTLITSNTSTSDSSSISSVVTSSTPPAPSAIVTQSVTSVSVSEPTSISGKDGKDGKNGNSINPAGIAVAVVFAVVLIISITWLVMRFCPPVRRRMEAYHERRRDERSYRDALAGMEKEKAETYSFSTSASRSRAPSDSELEAAARQLDVPPRLPTNAVMSNAPTELRGQQKHELFTHAQPRSINGHAPAPLDSERHYSWELPNIDTRGPVHQQFVSPLSADAPRGQGLGLGRVSVLRNNSLLRKAGYEVPSAQPGTMASPTEVGVAGAVRLIQISPVSPADKTAEKTQGMRRKPVPGSSDHPLELPGDIAPEPQFARAQNTQPHAGRQTPDRSRGRNSPIPHLGSTISPSPLIGMAISSTPPPRNLPKRVSYYD